MFVIDTLLANPYRALDDWGFITKIDSSSLRLAPIYDFGGSLLPLLSDEEMKVFLNTENRTADKTYISKFFPKLSCSVEAHNKKEDIFRLLDSEYREDCTAALNRILPKMDMKKISDILDDTPIISEIRRNFLKKCITERNEFILNEAYAAGIR